jgi:hypothetical protein
MKSMTWIIIHLMWVTSGPLDLISRFPNPPFPMVGKEACEVGTPFILSLSIPVHGIITSLGKHASASIILD